MQLHYVDTDSFVLSVITEDIIKALKYFDDLFDFSTSSENHDLFSDKNKKMNWKIQNRKS